MKLFNLVNQILSKTLILSNYYWIYKFSLLVALNYCNLSTNSWILIRKTKICLFFQVENCLQEGCKYDKFHFPSWKDQRVPWSSVGPGLQCCGQSQDSPSLPHRLESSSPSGLRSHHWFHWFWKVSFSFLKYILNIEFFQYIDRHYQFHVVKVGKIKWWLIDKS